MPSARMLIAKPPTIWSARRVTEKIACTSASTPPAAMPMRSPGSHEPVMSAPKIAKYAPISIMPSMPMFTTPERSHTIPPRAPNSSGVAKRSIAAKSADHTTTSSRFETPDRVAAHAPAPPMTPAATPPHPTRRSPWRAAHAPAPIAAAASTSDGTGVRTSTGGSAMNQASTPSATAPQAMWRTGSVRSASAVATAVLKPAAPRTARAGARGGGSRSPARRR
jgi:hypothetical protein